MKRLPLLILLLVLVGRWTPTYAEGPLDTLTIDGTTVNVYVPGISAQEVYAKLLANGLQPEVMLVRVDVLDAVKSMASVGGGRVTDIYGNTTYFPLPAVMQINTNDWYAHADYSIGHEYGHVWSNYWEWTNWQGSWDAYLAERGLLGDPRLYSDSCWRPEGLIAEDYRQLFAAVDTTPGLLIVQCPLGIPAASDVPGLRDWLGLTWTQGHPPPGYDALPTPTATPSIATATPSNPTATPIMGTPTPTKTPHACRARRCR